MLRNIPPLILLIAVALVVLVLFLARREPVRAMPREASAAEVAGCVDLGPVSGSSGYGNKFAWKPAAKADAGRKAAALGATHIVWVEFRPRGAFNGEVTARAFRCP